MMRSSFTLLTLVLVGFLMYLSLAQELNSSEVDTKDSNNKKIPIEVRDKQSNALLSSATIRIQSGKEYSKKINWKTPSSSWKPDGYKTYSFETVSNGYQDGQISMNVTKSTTLITLFLLKTPVTGFCGDGICSGTETGLPTAASRCFDCGRIRGVVSLAVGQKDQLSDITVSIWADPVNPALFLRNGTAVPAPQYTTVTDSKGFFAFNTLSFDAPSGNQSSGSSKRRFYFSLTGIGYDRTSGSDIAFPLLPLWWNYELTNAQWSGTGSTNNTNNSPLLYFYMSPPFTTSQALIRVILSWGTLISNPSTSLADLDLVVAGPVEPESISLYGSGIVNFQTKNLHGAINAIPFVRLISDSAQGFGPEVMDFYGDSSSSSLSLGFSTTYDSGALANAYEVWVDRPNSSPNSDSAFTYLFDTNSFIVIYQNNGSPGGNKQVLLDQITSVPFAYGFSNGDQWNKVPDTATLWHVFDLSQVVGSIVFNGFPGENGTDFTSIPGAKYGYDAQFFQSTKSIPCGHVAARGANPAYCPATLTYPQS